MSRLDYVKEIVENVQEQVKKKKIMFCLKAITPISLGYVPEIDSPPELEGEDITVFQELIGILRWAIETVCVDIHTKVFMLSSYQVPPPEEDSLNNLCIYLLISRNNRK